MTEQHTPTTTPLSPPPRPTDYFANANFPMDHDGRTYHVNTKYGQVANRIITVGDPHRVWNLAQYLDRCRDLDLKSIAAKVLASSVKNGGVELSEDERNLLPFFVHYSHRGFLTVTGTYKSVPISIVSIGMGLAMMDFFIREVRHVVKGPLAIIRFGSCGGIAESCRAGQIAVAKGSVCVQRNYFEDSYTISPIAPSDPALTETLLAKLTETFTPSGVISGLNATADSFYSTQGRIDSLFVDGNESLIADLKVKHPDAVTLEMESFMLFHLASRIADKSENKIMTAACTMIFFNRYTNEGVSKEQIQELESRVATALFDTLKTVEIVNGMDWGDFAFKN